MRIILIAGTWYSKSSYDAIWGNLARELHERFPEAHIYYEQAQYQLWDIGKIRALGEQIVAEHDCGEEVLLLGHSMGGIIACGIASKFKRSRVRGIVTVFSPHTAGHWFGLPVPWLDFSRLIFGHTTHLSVPVISFGGLFDPLVPFVFSRHPQAARHANLPSDHRFMLGWNSEIARRIGEETGDIYT